jgi:hypothetical protein
VTPESKEEGQTHSAIGRSAIRIFGSDLEQALFICDTTENGESAAAPGLRVIFLESPAQLKDGFAQPGIQAV